MFWLDGVQPSRRKKDPSESSILAIAVGRTAPATICKIGILGGPFTGINLAIRSRKV